MIASLLLSGLLAASGAGEPAWLELTPERLVFDDLRPGVAAHDTLVMANTSDRAVHVTAVLTAAGELVANGDVRVELRACSQPWQEQRCPGSVALVLDDVAAHEGTRVAGGEDFLLLGSHQTWLRARVHLGADASEAVQGARGSLTMTFTAMTEDLAPPSPTPDPTSSPTPTASPTVRPTPEPTQDPAPEPEPSPGVSAGPNPSPSPAVPEASPSPSPSSSPTPMRSSGPDPVGQAPIASDEDPTAAQPDRPLAWAVAAAGATVVVAGGVGGWLVPLAWRRRRKPDVDVDPSGPAEGAL